jgi:hypothetical protein
MRTFQSAIRGELHPADTKSKGYATYIPTAVIEKTRSLRPGRAVSSDLARIDTLNQENGGKLVRGSFNPPAWFPEVASALSTEVDNPAIISIFEVDDWDTIKSCRPLADRWMEILGCPLIPFDDARRKTLQAHAALTIDKLLQVRREASAEKAKKVQSQKDDDDEAGHTGEVLTGGSRDLRGSGEIDEAINEAQET